MLDAAPNETGKAMTGIGVMLGRCIIDPVCQRQKTKTADAHAAETGALIQALHRAVPIRGTVHELMIPQDHPLPVCTDALAVLIASSGGSHMRNTPWLLARTAVVLQAVEEKHIKLYKLDGLKNPTNSFTKYTVGEEFTRDMDFMTNAIAAKEADGLRKAITSVDDADADATVADLRALVQLALDDLTTSD